MYPKPLFCFGGPDASPPIQFSFHDPSGFLAFVDADSEPLLLVSDAGMDAVHVLNVVTKEHCGYLGVPHTFHLPSGVATTGHGLGVIAAVASRNGRRVHIFGRTDVCSWTPLQVINCHAIPLGVRLFAGACVVARLYSKDDADPGSVSWYSVQDGTLLRMQSVYRPLDVEVLHDHRYFVTSGQFDNCVHFKDVSGTQIQVLGGVGNSFGMLDVPTALCFVPQMGILIRSLCNEGRVSVYATEETVRRETMSVSRVHWMGAVVRVMLSL